MRVKHLSTEGLVKKLSTFALQVNGASVFEGIPNIALSGGTVNQKAIRIILDEFKAYKGVIVNAVYYPCP